MNVKTRRWAIAVTIAAALVIVAGWAILQRASNAGTGDQHRLRVLAILPMTGPGASLGEFLKNGLELGQEDVERRFGGTLKVELTVVDSKNQPREGVNALQQALALSRPDAIVCAMSSVSSAVAPIVDQRGLPCIVTTTAMAGLPQDNASIVRVYPTSEDFVAPIAAEIARLHKRVSILYVHDDFGDSNQRIMTALLKDAGVAVAASEPYELTEKDFRALVNKVLRGGPEAVFVTGYGPAFISIIRQVRELNRSLPVYTEIGFANPAVLDALGADAEGVVFNGTDLELDESETEQAQQFVRRYQERFGKRPYQVAGFARDSLVMLAEAGMTTGRFEPPTKQRLIALSPFDGVMGQITLDEAGECRVQLQLMERVEGANRRRPGPGGP